MGCPDCGCKEVTVITKKGEKGDVGPIGGPGPVGGQGTIGAPGANGQVGATGQQGIQGDQGIQGIAGPAGAATSMDISGATLFQDATPIVIPDVGWSGFAVSSDDMVRTEFGDFNVFSGILNFTGTYDGIGSSNLLIEYGGPLLSTSPGNYWTNIVYFGNIGHPVKIFPDNVGPVGYLRIIFDESLPVGVSTPFLLDISGMTFY